MRILITIISSLWLAVTSPATTAAFTGGPDRLSASEDPRLDQRVTIHNRRIAIGDLMSNLSSRTNVSLSAGLRDGTSDPEILVSFDQTRLIDVMNSIASLFSYNAAEWIWSREGETKTSGYKLNRSSNARRLPESMSAWVRSRVERDFAFHVRMPSLDPTKRRAASEEYVRDVFPDQPELVDALVDPKNQNEWLQMALFTEALPEAAQRGVLNGDAVRLSTEQLPAKWQPFLGQMRDAAGGSVVVNGERVTGGKWLEFFTLFDAISGTPTIYIQLEYLGGPGLVGGVPLARAFQRKFDPEWIITDDRGQDSRESEVLRSTSDTAAGTSYRSGVSTDADILMRVSVANKLPLIALLPWANEGIRLLKEPGGATTLRGLLDEPGVRHYIHKWNGSALLVSYRGWYHVSMHPPTYRHRQELRAATKRLGGHLDLSDIARSFSLCTVTELVQLSSEFPALRDAMPLRSFLEWLGNNPNQMAALLGDNGADYEAMMPALRQTPLSAQLDGLVAKRPSRVVCRTTSDTARKVLMHNFIVLSDDKSPIVGFGFGQPLPDSTLSPRPDR